MGCAGGEGDTGVTSAEALHFPISYRCPSTAKANSKAESKGTPPSSSRGDTGKGRKGVGKMWSDPTEDTCDCPQPPQSWAPTEQEHTYRQKTGM